MKTILIAFTILSGLTSFTTPIVCFNNEFIMTHYESYVAILFYGGGFLAMVLSMILSTQKK